MKTLVGAFNQEKALIGAFSVRVKSSVVTMMITGNDPPLYRILHRQRPQFTVIYQLFWHLILKDKISENVRVLKILRPREKIMNNKNPKFWFLHT